MKKRLLPGILVSFLLLPAILFGAEKESISMPSNFLKAPNPKFQNNMEKLLNKKISVNFENAHVREVIQYLSFVGGLSIVLDETPFNYESAAIEEPPMEDANAENIEAFTDKVKKSKYVLTVHLNDIPIKNVLWYVCNKSDLMAFFDEDIDENIPGPIVITSKEQAERIIEEKTAKRKRENNLQRALHFNQRYK